MLDIQVFFEIDAIESGEKGAHYVLFMTEEYLPEIEALRARFKEARMHGVVVPHLVLGDTLLERGIMVLHFHRKNSVVEVFDMEQPVGDIDELIERNGSRMLLLFIDGLSASMEPFVTALNESLSREVMIMGGGGGYKGLEHRPMIFDDAGFYRDHALMIGTDLVLTAGVRHGWKSLYGPLVVTKVENNVLYELNGEKAFDVYRRALQKSEDIDIDPEDFFSVAKSYPLGIASFTGNEFIIRDPIAANSDGSMTIVSSVEVFDSLYIMKGERDVLVDSTCELAREVFSRTDSPVALIFDCISRVLFLEEEFPRELEAVTRCSGYESVRLFGMTSIGEISNQGYNEIKIFNKTTLLGSLNVR